ncbi:MAG: 3-dehydroquinate synthase [Ignavibacteria bacterium]|nr:3-dehydroquinate synthase [Ignavibacteria bacterium]MBI3766382.1 3-dehydroquinate synthase [Ignavibacteriales bacterium]
MTPARPSRIETVTVDLGERSYSIYVGRGTLRDFPEIAIQQNLPKRIAIVTDVHVAVLHLQRFVDALRSHEFEVKEIIIPSGERQKSLRRANVLYSELLRGGFTRHSAIIALGGGVIGDLTGFIAATYKRGIHLIQVPTTLLSQVESCIGGKTAVNHPLGKNAIGAFYQPRFVFSDVEFLSTLPPREITCGLGEALKYAILHEPIFDFLDKHIETIYQKRLDILQELVLLCNRYKSTLITQDERELDPNGGRMVLNLGHAIGHALETVSNYKLHHGEAVVIGLRWELHLAKEASIISDADFKKISGLIDRTPLKVDVKFLRDSSSVIALMKKVNGARFVLPAAIGRVSITHSIEPSMVKAVVKNMIKK